MGSRYKICWRWVLHSSRNEGIIYHLLTSSLVRHRYIRFAKVCPWVYENPSKREVKDLEVIEIQTKSFGQLKAIYFGFGHHPELSILLLLKCIGNVKTIRTQTISDYYSYWWLANLKLDIFYVALKLNSSQVSRAEAYSA